MTLQMNTMNPEALRAELARCSGSVAAVLPDGTPCSTGAALSVPRSDRYTPLHLTLKIQQPGDYMRLACFAIGDV